MNKNIGYFLSFATGIGSGIICGWFLVKRKYEKIAQNEINSVKRAYSSENKVKKVVEDIEDAKNSMEKLSDSAETAMNTYLGKKTRAKSKELDPNRPYVISVDEYGSILDYDTITLLYYADGVLADENDDLVDDPDDIVGSDFPDHFGEYDPDSVYIRNDRLKCDYEILREIKTYDEILEEKPYLKKYNEDDDE